MKIFTVMSNVGKARHLVNFHDGKKMHKDGSKFFDIKIIKNKKDLKLFTNALLASGYKERI